MTQIIPFVYQLIQPKFKEINFDLMTQNEKDKIINAVNIMILMGISLKNIIIMILNKLILNLILVNY